VGVSNQRAGPLISAFEAEVRGRLLFSSPSVRLQIKADPSTTVEQVISESAVDVSKERAGPLISAFEAEVCGLLLLSPSYY
jgi:hypothetical protein